MTSGPGVGGTNTCVADPPAEMASTSSTYWLPPMRTLIARASGTSR